MPYRRRITIRRQSGGDLCSFRGHPERALSRPSPGSEPSQDYSRIFISSTTAASAAAVLGVMPNLPGSGTAT